MYVHFSRFELPIIITRKLLHGTLDHLEILT